MPELTPRIGLLRPLGTDNVTRAAYAENLDIIDAAVVRPQDVPAAEVTVDPASAPTGNAGTVGQLLGWLANRLKAITGAANWWSTPATTLAATAQHIGAGGTAHATATTSAAGFMSAADKAKIDGAMARMLYVGDDTVKSAKGTSATTIKSHRLVCSATHGLAITTVHVVAETYRQTSGTGYLDVYIDGTLAFTLSTTASSYELVQGSKGVSWDDNTVHTVEIKLRHSSTSYYTYNRLYECYVEVG